jgi:hypothetical protein
MPLVEVFSGYLRELFAIGNDVAMRINEFIKFPVCAPPIKQLASLAEMSPIEPCLLACPVELREFGLKFGTMPAMK